MAACWRPTGCRAWHPDNGGIPMAPAAGGGVQGRAHLSAREHGAAQQGAGAAQREGLHQLPQVLHLQRESRGRASAMGTPGKSRPGRGPTCMPQDAGRAAGGLACWPAATSAHLLCGGQVLHAAWDVLQRLVLHTGTHAHQVSTPTCTSTPLIGGLSSRQRQAAQLRPCRTVHSSTAQRLHRRLAWGCRKETWLSRASTPRSPPAPASSSRYLQHTRRGAAGWAREARQARGWAALARAEGNQHGCSSQAGLQIDNSSKQTSQQPHTKRTVR